MLDDFKPLTDSQVQAGARPGESWEAARCRLEEACQVGTDTGGIFSWVRSLHGSLSIRPNQLDAVKAYQKLSSREQFESWGFSSEILAAIQRNKVKSNRSGFTLKGVPAMPTHEQTIKAQADAERVIGEISHASTEVEADELVAVARGYATALCDQMLIGHTQWIALLDRIDQVRRAWSRPDRGKGGDYQ